MSIDVQQRAHESIEAAQQTFLQFGAVVLVCVILIVVLYWLLGRND